MIKKRLRKRRRFQVEEVKAEAKIDEAPVEVAHDSEVVKFEVEQAEEAKDAAEAVVAPEETVKTAADTVKTAEETVEAPAEEVKASEESVAEPKKEENV